MSLVRVFEDAGKSGLNVRGRDSLRKMIEVVESGSADFKCILAYDVSRWGRFQYADESGFRVREERPSVASWIFIEFFDAGPNTIMKRA